MDPAEKRRAFEALKELAGNGRLVAEPRKKFSRAVRTQVLERQDGLCTACEGRIFGKFDIDHIKALELGGSNDLTNLVALHPECHAVKTRRDIGMIAKARRITKRETEGPKPAKLKSNGAWPRSSRPIQSRGFDKPRKVEVV